MPRRELTANLVLALAASAVGLVLSEGLARLLLEPVPEVRFVDTSSAADRARQRRVTTDALGLTYDTLNGRRMHPNRSVEIRNHPLCHCSTRVETNSLGFRNRELGPKRERRVLFLGDSVTVEEYLPEPETFVRLTETIARQTGASLETVNAGVGAASLVNELGILEEVGLRTSPDVVVVDFFLNDALPSRGVRVETLPWPLSASRLATRAAWRFGLLRADRGPGVGSNLPPDVEKRWQDSVRRRFPDRPDGFLTLVADCADDWGAGWVDEAWDQMAPVFHELQRLAAARGFELVLVGFPVVGQVRWPPSPALDYPQSRLKEVGRSLGVRVLDLLPALRRAAHQHPDQPLFLDHCHPTAFGSLVIARELAALLAGAPSVSMTQRPANLRP